jgi:deoxyribodipyrimidine photolyase-related protein
MNEVALVYPHQLFWPHPAFEKNRLICLIEDPLIFGNDHKYPLKIHGKKLVLHRASMKAYQDELIENGFKVHYIENTSNDGINILAEKLRENITSIYIADVTDHILSKRLKSFCNKKVIQLHIYDSPNFLTPPVFLEKQLNGKKRPFMAKFYQSQRERMGVLLENDGSPMGGKWSFDEDNRKKLPKKFPLLDKPFIVENDYVKEAKHYISGKFPKYLGSLENFRWPVTRKDSENWWQNFLQERLHQFGDYEDAITKRDGFLFHSAITPMLNIGLLNPQVILDQTLEYANKSKSVPLNSLEGFVRQVIGWREFIHGMYLFYGTQMRNGNFWNFSQKVPEVFYTAQTGIAPVDRVITQLLEEGYCHHIERLMVLGNFMLLCRIHPEAVYRWFMEFFIDAYDWVMVPNVYGMSQFADGGIFATKPYISGSNYVLKMSDEPKGGWCEIWDALFWTMIEEQREFYLKNHRLSMMVHLWDKMPVEKKDSHRSIAENYLTQLF